MGKLFLTLVVMGKSFLRYCLWVIFYKYWLWVSHLLTLLVIGKSFLRLLVMGKSF